MTNHNHWQQPGNPPQPNPNQFQPQLNNPYPGANPHPSATQYPGGSPFSESGNFTDGWSDALNFETSGSSTWGGDFGGIGGSNNNNNNNNNNNG